MKFSLSIQIALLVALGIGGATVAWTSEPVQAAQFDKTELDVSKFIIIASPIGTTDSYKLLIFEQLNNRRLCWQEVPGTPTTIDPLFMQFDFTKICGRSTDSNAYSVRVGDEDLAGRYNLRIVKKQNELVLVAFSLTDKNLRLFEIGRTHGLSDGYLKIDLDPGWRLTRRVFQGKPTGHLYFTTDRTLGDLANQATPLSQPEQSPTTPPVVPSQSSVPAVSPSDAAPSGSAPLDSPPTQNLSLPAAPPTGAVMPSYSTPVAPGQTQSLPASPASQNNGQDVIIPVAPGETLPAQ
ncbi:DUF3747 domain-containing protein [Leptodesmis sichuanensis]|uniref:DUF3747 domain-containing protein n=1 Tax=Leptodesmis sichuanensis TaxID=2906798 RepID=UPI001F3046FF|nr:DUF3747 domain-containing protein [Leptodesmis sichuanensis]UIE36067.1 DUF3747 domain-containing protein [Leptodesmis sichuanensis A121]